MKLAIIPAAVAVLLAATGCSAGIQATATEPTSSSSAAAPATPETTPEPVYEAPAEAPAEESALMVKFGEPVKYDDGTVITVRHTGAAVASPYAAPEAARGKAVQLFEITLVNGTKKTFDPSLFNESAVYGKAGKKAEKVFDTNFSTGYFEGQMIPKGTQTIQVALLIPAAELPTTVFTVAPSWDHTEAVVTGGL